jgi:hypothetical protein
MTTDNEAAWCVAATKPLTEHIAAAALSAIGYECWVPVYRKRFRGNRFENGRRIRSRNDTFGPRPLFLAYCFVQVPFGGIARDIDRTRGVLKLIRHAPPDEFTFGQPKRIRNRVMQQLREAVDAGLWEDENGSLRTGDAEPLSPGSTVRTPTGIVAVVLSLDDKGRADLLAEMLGSSRVIRGVDARRLEFVA